MPRLWVKPSLNNLHLAPPALEALTGVGCYVAPWQIYFLSHVKKVQYIFYDDLLNYSKLDSANLFELALVRWQRMPVMYQ